MKNKKSVIGMIISVPFILVFGISIIGYRIVAKTINDYKNK
jgi:hypothetical protein